MITVDTSNPEAQALVVTERYYPWVRQWALRVLVDGYGHRLLFHRGRLNEEEVLVDLGLLEDESLSPSPLELQRQFRELLHEERPCPNLPDGNLGNNLRKLGESLSLSQIECEVLGFLVIKEQDHRLSHLLDLFGQRRWLGAQQLSTLISLALQRPRCAISDVLTGACTLRQCGLISPEDHRNGSDLLDGLDDLLFHEAQGAEVLLRSFTATGAPAHLSETDFLHVKPIYQRLKRYIDRAACKQMTGVNVLLYGPPGSGKTQMVRTLSASLDLQLHEVKSTHGDGRPMTGDRRLGAYLAAQKMLAADRNSLMLFDEVEDIFNDKVSNQHKAWINQTLEQNERPSFWLTNSISALDPAYVRRFDLVVEMPELNQQARLTIARSVLKGIKVREEWLMTLAKRKGLHAAHLSQAAKVVKVLGYRKPERNEAEIDAVLAALYQALGYREKRKQPEARKGYYNPTFSNTDQSLTALIDGIKRSRMGRICLYGPPGTGKSGFAGYLSESLGMPLISKKASDLLDMYLGNTEKALASAFCEAREQQGILLIDEADSFLAPREQAQRSWEVTQVNELLVQMEEYEGILIMSTNFMDHVDNAALRRFDFKIRFGYLSQDQVWMFFNHMLGRTFEDGFEVQAVDACRDELARLDKLTPGDFATVERHCKVMGEPLTAARLLHGLQTEHEVKAARMGRRIGFF